MTLFLHILAGGAALVLGVVALSPTKGSGLHRTSGIWFVYAMLVMSAAGVMMASLRGVAPAVNIPAIPAGLLTAYFVVTGLATLRPRSARSRFLDLAAMIVAFGVGLTSLALGLQALAGRVTMNRLLIAATAFFVGQPNVFPKALRRLPLLALPVLVVLAVMFYWLWRVRIKGGYRAVIGVPDRVSTRYTSRRLHPASASEEAP